MPIAPDANLGSNFVNDGGTTVSITLASIVPVGRHVIVWIGGQTAVRRHTITDTRGNTYQNDIGGLIGNAWGISGGLASSRITTQLQVGDTITATFTVGDARAIAADSFTGLATSNWFDKIALKTALAGANDIYGVMLDEKTSQAEELVIGWAVVNGNRTFAPIGTLWNEVVDLNISSGASLNGAYKIASYRDAFGYDAHLSGFAGYIAGLVTYKGAAAGTDPIVPELRVTSAYGFENAVFDAPRSGGFLKLAAGTYTPQTVTGWRGTNQLMIWPEGNREDVVFNGNQDFADPNENICVGPITFIGTGAQQSAALKLGGVGSKRLRMLGTRASSANASTYGTLSYTQSDVWLRSGTLDFDAYAVLSGGTGSTASTLSAQPFGMWDTSNIFWSQDIRFRFLEQKNMVNGGVRITRTDGFRLEDNYIHDNIFDGLNHVSGFRIWDVCRFGRIKNIRIYNIDGIPFEMIDDVERGNSPTYDRQDIIFENLVADSTGGASCEIGNCRGISFMNLTVDRPVLLCSKAASDLISIVNSYFKTVGRGTGGYNLTVGYKDYNIFTVDNTSFPGAHETSTAPTFVDSANDDFRLTGSSAGLDAGVASIAILNLPATDIRGKARSGNPDLGAYERVTGDP